MKPKSSSKFEMTLSINKCKNRWNFDLTWNKKVLVSTTYLTMTENYLIDSDGKVPDQAFAMNVSVWVVMR